MLTSKFPLTNFSFWRSPSGVRPVSALDSHESLRPAAFRAPLFAFLVWAILGTSLPAATFYVATSGNDTQPGTSALPFRTVQRGVDVAQPGDTILVAAGNYPEEVRSVRNGTATGLITIDGQSNASIRSFALGHSYHKLQKLKLTGPVVQYQSLLAVKLDAHHNTVVDNIIDAADALKVYGISWTAGPVLPFELWRRP